MTLPNFIVIGAAKAGTTALYWYLAEHPQVFMSKVKETNFFACETDDKGRLTYGDPQLHHFPVRSMEAYEQLFHDAGDALAIGEASPIYLECPRSAGRIHEAIPDAKIICGLRNPVDRAYSDYQMFLRGQGRTLDPVRDFAPDAAWLQPQSHFMQVSRYYDSLLRYVDTFGRENVHVFLFDDLKRDPQDVARKVYDFVGVDDNYLPDVETPYNTGGLPENMLLERVFHSAAAVRSAIEPWLPRRATNWLRRLRASNMQKAPPLPVELKARLMEDFREDIERTAGLIGRDLDGWLQQEPLRKAG